MHILIFKLYKYILLGTEQIKCSDVIMYTKELYRLERI